MGEFSAFEGGDKAIADEVRREIAVANGKVIDVDSDDDDDDAMPTWNVSDSPVKSGNQASPSERYHLLSASTKLAIIAFLVELAMQTKTARDVMEESTNQLTEVRKELQEVKRERKKM